MIISKEKKYVYIAIPKTASKTISCVLGQTQHPEPPIYHMSIKTAIEQNPEIENYYHWSFVRNPFSRIVSVYFDFTKNRINQYSERIKLDKPLLSEFSSFKDFCIRLCDSHWSKDLFFLPQSDFVKKKDGKLIDFIGKQENLQEDFKKICLILNLGNINLIHVNKGLYDKNWKDYYEDKEQIDAVKKLYQEDIEKFQYEF